MRMPRDRSRGGAAVFALAMACVALRGDARPAEGPTVVVQRPSVSKGVEPDVADALGELFAEGLTRSQVFSRLVTMRDIGEMLRHEQERQLLGCDDSSESCLAEIGGALGATHLSLLDVKKLGSAHVVSARLVDLRTARVVFRQTRTIAALEGAVPAVEELARKLGASLLDGGGGGDVTTTGADELLAARAREASARRESIEKVQARARDEDERAAAARAERLKQADPGMVLVSGGPFFFGCNAQVDPDCLENEKPGRQLDAPAFKIDLREVTLGEYEACVDAGACTAPDGEGFGCTWGSWFDGDKPANCVDWLQAKKFCEWKGKRLPEAREWEKAARGVDGRRYPWGNDLPAAPPAQLAPAADAVADVGSHPAGASPYGVLDMAGNVAEWTATTYDEKRYEYRGGGFMSSARYARTSDRHRAEIATQKPDLGFRCAL